ncbi:MAG: exodeoxyribonuclease VII small subunit [bacterium]
MSESIKFEDGLADLERLVAELEAGDLGLDEALKRFEKGVKLAGQMQKVLEDTGRKIEQLGSAGGKVDGGTEEGEVPGPRLRGSKAVKPSPPMLF